MTLKQLEYFLAFASSLNYTTAAQECFTTQPNLGRQIKNIEKELGTPLTLRVEGKNILTESGILLVERGKQLISFYNEMVAELKSGSKPDIIFGYTTRHALMDELRDYIGDVFLGHRIQWVHGTGDVLINAGLLDMCFTFYSPKKNYVKLDEAKIYAIVPRTLLPVCSQLEPEDLDGRPIMLPDGNLREACLNFFQEFNIHPIVREFPFALFDKSVYLEHLESTKSIGFVPIDDYRMYDGAFFCTKVNGMRQTIPIGIQWSEKKDAACSLIAEKLSERAKIILKKLPADII